VDKAKQKKESITLTDRFRIWFKDILLPIGKFLNRLGLTPNMMTLLGLLRNVIGAVFLAKGEMVIGGIIILVVGPIDALDGTMARLRGMDGQFGAFVDSVTDRYSELVIYGGLLYYFANQSDLLGTMLVFVAAGGSVLVSYVRARGQSLGWDTKIGILTRVERYLVLAPTLIINQPMWGIAIIAVFANITAIQRIVDVRRQARQAQSEE